MNLCPQCRRSVSHLHGRESSRDPTAGDLVVCLACGAICRFNAALQLHVLTPIEARALDPMLVMQAIVISDRILAGHRRH